MLYSIMEAYPSDVLNVSLVNIADALTTTAVEQSLSYALVALWALGITSFFLYTDNTITMNEDGHWKPVGSYYDCATYTSHLLYEQKYPSGKKAWRYMGKKGYLYPKGREVALYGSQLS